MWLLGIGAGSLAGRTEHAGGRGVGLMCGLRFFFLRHDTRIAEGRLGTGTGGLGAWGWGPRERDLVEFFGHRLGGSGVHYGASARRWGRASGERARIHGALLFVVLWACIPALRAVNHKLYSVLCGRRTTSSQVVHIKLMFVRSGYATCLFSAGTRARLAGPVELGWTQVVPAAYLGSHTSLTCSLLRAVSARLTWRE